MKTKLKREFFEWATLRVARDLIGCELVLTYRGKKLRGTIVETEAYCGARDLACHSASAQGGQARRTARTEVMFGPAGHAYVYFVYGMHWCFNIVTRKAGEPEAVLIRGIEIQNAKVKGQNSNAKLKIMGPGRVAKYFHIDKSLYGEDLVASKRLWLEEPGGETAGKFKIVRTPRIGVAYAGKYAQKPWRFVAGA